MAESIEELRQLLEQLSRDLSASEARFQNTILRNSDGVIIVDQAGIVRFVNPAAEGLLGQPGQTLSGQAFEFPISTGESIELDLPPAGRDGQPVVIEIHAQETEWEGQAAFMLSLRDVTARRLADDAARREAEERIRYDAQHDPLTGLPNRSAFLEQLERALRMSRRHDAYQAAVLVIDIDRFKVVNDSLGHPSGDQMLVDLSARLRRCLHAGDTVARLGGDEFAVLAEDLQDTEDAIRLAECLHREIALPLHLNDQEVFPSASIGIAFTSSTYSRPEDLLRDADTAMYRAKANGKARFEIFHADMHTRALAMLQLEAHLWQAVARQEFQVHYQPIVAIESGEITGVEALLRWRHPERGLIPPEEFIPLAEENGLILPIGEWVLRTACKQTKSWHEAGYTSLRVAVNISSRQFQDPNFAAMIQSVLDETGLDGHFLELEITESIAMQDSDRTIALLHELNVTGVQISIDDFGNRYSSLGYLNRFPIHTLKIDRSFVDDISDNQDGAAIATAIITMAHVLKLNVIAEGVQTEKQLAFLALRQCDEIQGYFVRPAMPPDAITKLLGNPRDLLSGGRRPHG